MESSRKSLKKNNRQAAAYMEEDTNSNEGISLPSPTLSFVSQTSVGQLKTRINSPKPPIQRSKVRSISDEERKKIRTAILKTFVSYSQLEINLPNGQGTVKVRAAYWIGSRKGRVPDHNRLINGLSKEIEADIQKRNPEELPEKVLKNKGKTLRIEMNSGKASPEKLKQFIEIAVQKAYSSSSKKRKKEKLPALGNDPSTWKDDIQKWINKYQIGIDCSGFVFEALRKVHRDIGGKCRRRKIY